jgi:hypothetical protein
MGNNYNDSRIYVARLNYGLEGERHTTLRKDFVASTSRYSRSSASWPNQSTVSRSLKFP